MKYRIELVPQFHHLLLMMVRTQHNLSDLREPSQPSETTELFSVAMLCRDACMTRNQDYQSPLTSYCYKQSIRHGQTNNAMLPPNKQPQTFVPLVPFPLTLSQTCPTPSVAGQLQLSRRQMRNGMIEPYSPSQLFPSPLLDILSVSSPNGQSHASRNNPRPEGNVPHGQV
jgi:hypothetical protein